MRTRWLAALVVGPAMLMLVLVAPQVAAASTRSPAVCAIREVATQNLSRTTGGAVVGAATPDALGGDGPSPRPLPTVTPTP